MDGSIKEEDQWIVYDCDLGGPFILEGNSKWAEQIEDQIKKED